MVLVAAFLLHLLRLFVICSAVPSSAARHSKHVPGGLYVIIDCPERIFSDVGSDESHAQLIHNHVDAHTDRILSQLPGAKLRRVFKSEVLCGMSIQFEGQIPIEQVLAIEGVQSASPIKLYRHSLKSQAKHPRTHSRPRPPTHASPRVKSPAAPHKDLHLSHARIAASRNSKRPTSVEKKTSVPIKKKVMIPSVPAHGSKKNTFAPHVQTEVDKMHSLGLFGDSKVKVCLADTGVDYKNEMLGGGFGPKFHVAFGYDFVSEDGTATDSDPYTNCSTHGTLTTGIIGAYYNKQFEFSGIAPEVTLGHYRVLPCDGLAPGDVIISALTRGLKDGCNIMSLSFGSGGSWDDISDPLFSVIERVIAKGMLIVASAGNDGQEGFFYPERPGSLPGVLSVGAANVPYYPVGYELGFDDPAFSPITYFSVFPINIETSLDVHLVEATLNADTACNTPSTSKVNFSKTLVLFANGECGDDVIANWAAKVGAPVAVEFGLNGDDPQDFEEQYTPNDVKGLVHHLVLPASSGKKLVEFYKKSNGKLRVNFRSKARVPAAARQNNELGPRTDYSSYGPSMTLKTSGVQVIAPGSNILSTFPISDGGVGVATGTSMAAPAVAAIAGLLLSHRKEDKLTPEQLITLIATTTKPIVSGLNVTGSKNTVLQQGNGMVSALRAYQAKTLVMPHQLALRDPLKFIDSHVITLKNTNKHAVTYTFDSIAAQSYATFQNGSHGINGPDVSVSRIDGAAIVSFRPTRVTVEPGHVGSVTVHFVPPKFSKDDLDRLPLYSGFININAALDPVKTYTVSYFGAGSSLRDFPTLDTSELMVGLNYNIKGIKYPFMIQGKNGALDVIPTSADDVIGNTVKVSSVTRANGVIVFIRLAMPTRLLQVDVIDGEENLVPTLPNAVKNAAKLRGLHAGKPKGTRSLQTFDSVKTLGQVHSFVGVVRSTDRTSSAPDPDVNVYFNGKVTRSTGATLGNTLVLPSRKLYRILVRALKPEADPKFSDSYEHWTSPAFLFID